VLYAGDDVTDEHAFAAVASRENADDVTVKVGDGETAARYRVGGPEDVTDLLRELVAARRSA
jgi:trehalose 6-phosphate phosphatase